MVEVGVRGFVEADVDALLLLNEPHVHAAGRHRDGGVERNVREPVVGIGEIVGFMDCELGHQIVTWLAGVVLVISPHLQGEGFARSVVVKRGEVNPNTLQRVRLLDVKADGDRSQAQALRLHTLFRSAIVVGIVISNV